MFVGGFSIASLFLLLFDWQILCRELETPAFRVRSLTDLFYCASVQKLFLEIECVGKKKISKENSYKIVK